MIKAFWEFVFFSAQAQIKVIAHAAHVTVATQKADRRQVRAGGGAREGEEPKLSENFLR